MNSNPILDSMLSSLDDNASTFLMQYGKRRTFLPGELLTREGADCEQVYIILNGTANVIKDDVQHNANVIAQVHKGAVIGEMGVFMDLKRSATIRAEEDLIALELNNEDFVSALLNFPALTVRLLRSLSNKLSDINQRLVDTLHNNHLLFLGHCLAEKCAPAEITSATMHNNTHTIHLKLAPIATESGLSRLDLTNALIHFKQAGVIEDLHFQKNDQVECHCKISSLHTFLRTRNLNTPE